MTDRDTTTRTRARAPGVEETPASFEARSAPRSYPTDLHRPRAVRWRPRGRRRSVGRGGHRPAIEPRKPIPGCRRRFERGRQHVSDAPSQGPNGPAWSENLACAEAPWTGTGRSHVWPAAVRRSGPHQFSITSGPVSGRISGPKSAVLLGPREVPEGKFFS